MRKRSTSIESKTPTNKTNNPVEALKTRPAVTKSVSMSAADGSAAPFKIQKNSPANTSFRTQARERSKHLEGLISGLEGHEQKKEPEDLQDQLRSVEEMLLALQRDATEITK